VSRFSLLIVVLAQLQMAIKISALPVSLGPISEDLGAPATATARALLIYSLFVATFVMLGAKTASSWGSGGSSRPASSPTASPWR
jgi:hypothetical protein